MKHIRELFIVLMPVFIFISGMRLQRLLMTTADPQDVLLALIWPMLEAWVLIFVVFKKV